MGDLTEAAQLVDELHSYAERSVNGCAEQSVLEWRPSELQGNRKARTREQGKDHRCEILSIAQFWSLPPVGDARDANPVPSII